MLTQDATYLCNKLDLQYVPQPSYPFFHLKMEDVWVWDKNRPTRIIPRAEVYTSSDVTVEELRGEGDEPSLTAEALAERIGESLVRTTTSSARAMLLAIDVGNTQTVFGLFDGRGAAEHWRIATERNRSGDELGALYGSFLDLDRGRRDRARLDRAAARTAPTRSSRSDYARRSCSSSGPA